MTALSAASRCGNLMLVGMLLDNGADVNASELSQSPSALCQASSNGHEVIARTLLDHGAKIGTAALVQAAKEGHKQVVELLLFYGADVNVDLHDELGTSPLEAASAGGHLEIARTLLDSKAEIRHALLYAAFHGHEKVVELLLSCGADVNAWVH
jgi:ankyrin repeat protein